MTGSASTRDGERSGPDPGSSSRIVLPFPDRSFSCIEADPPWCYRDRGYNGFATVQRYRIHCPYSTMSLAQIAAMGPEISRIAQFQSHLWLWATKDFLDAAFPIIAAWGFATKQVFVWAKTGGRKGLARWLRSEFGLRGIVLGVVVEVLARLQIPGKPRYGMGHWGRNAIEFLLFATRGALPMLNARTSTSTLFFAPASRHSEKPGGAYGMIESLSPAPRLSMFARGRREGWTSWGDEIREECEDRS